MLVQGSLLTVVMEESNLDVMICDVSAVTENIESNLTCRDGNDWKDIYLGLELTFLIFPHDGETQHFSKPILQ